MPAATKLKAEELYVCHESFASNEHAVSRGAKFRGDNPIVQKYPQFFIPAATPDDLWPRPAPLPVPEKLAPGRYKLKILPGSPATRGMPRAWVGNRPYHDGDTLEADAVDASHLVDAGVAEIVKKLRSPKEDTSGD
jgi:hypothetical protein